MADAANVAARREARRRKILENSHNRLQIISGKSVNECARESPIKTVIPEPEYDFSATVSNSSYSSSISTSQQNGLFSTPDGLFELLSTTHDIDAAGDGEVNNDLASLLPPLVLGPPNGAPAEPKTLSLCEKITTYKYDLVLLSLLLQILYSLSLFTFDNGYFFLPVLVYVVTKLIWFPTQNNSSIANMLMLLNGISPVRIQRILYLSHCFGVVTCDIFVFLFTTICLQSLWVTLRDNFVT